MGTRVRQSRVATTVLAYALSVGSGFAWWSCSAPECIHEFEWVSLTPTTIRAGGSEQLLLEVMHSEEFAGLGYPPHPRVGYRLPGDYEAYYRSAVTYLPHDDGAGGDRVAGDGVYSMLLENPFDESAAAGTYLAVISNDWVSPGERCETDRAGEGLLWVTLAVLTP
jgi:hypothetical protein